MRALIIGTLLLASGSLWAATIPRQSPDFTIQMTDGKQVKVSDYRGKVLCLTFILTTCPHCQKTTQLWDNIYPELAPKGLEVVEAALNDNPNIPQFVSQFKCLVDGDHLRKPQDSYAYLPVDSTCSAVVVG